MKVLLFGSCLVLLALTISGCGGGGDPTPAPAYGPTPAPTPAMTVKLNNGVEMPALAFAAQVWEASTCKSATSSALQAGFRHVWSSALVGDDCQKSQWDAISASSVPLKDIFVGGTVNTRSCYGHDDCYQQTMAGAESQFQMLPKAPLDMLMLDYPSSASGCGGVLGQWEAFEVLYAEKRVRTIAVSNFNKEQLMCIVAISSLTVPSVNQLPYSIGHGADTVVAEDGSLGIHVMAYSPLSSVKFKNPLLVKIAAAHGKSTAQVALRWIIQRNVSIATQSTNPAHLRQDASIFYFSLSEGEMAQLNALPGNTLMV